MLAELVEDLLGLEGGEDASRSAPWRGSCRAEGRGPPGRGGRRRSTAAPRGGSPSWAGRSTGRCRARPARARCGRSRGPSRRATPRRGSPSTSTCFSGRCQPRGRTRSVADSLLQGVDFALGAREGDGAAHGVAHVDLAVEHVLPGGRSGVLEVGHEALRTGVERVDHHLAVDRAGDLGAAIDEVGRRRRHPPVAGADRARSRAGSRGARPASISRWRSTRRASSSPRRGPNSRNRPARKSQASGVRISSVCAIQGPAISRPATFLREFM